MKMLTMPDYFPETMSWDARRKILLDICGDVTDADVIAANPALAELHTFLLMPAATTQLDPKNSPGRWGEVGEDRDRGILQAQLNRRPSVKWG